MRNKLIGKAINEWAANRNDLPTYWGNRYCPENQDWDKPQKRINGEFIAKKYNAITQIIQEVSGQVQVNKDHILVTYSNGNIKIDRDLLTDNFLLPLININTGFQSINL